MVRQAVRREKVQTSALFFADIEPDPSASFGWKLAHLSGKDVLFGSLGVLGGSSLILALALAEAWPILALAGAAALGVGIGSFWRRARPSD